MRREFKCRQCGNCCEHYGAGLDITQRDFRMWKEADAKFILAFVKTYRRNGREYAEKKIWRNPRNKKELLFDCPFLYEVVDGRGKSKKVCGIHSLKPETCREFMTPEWDTDRFDCHGWS